ncbi:MFS transporter [Sphingomonas sp.]|uniref:MFS transporter n=1 Tax=Sphingomonas sp. TaxID=28214 RepID=UPI0025D6084B|nr:MFS transporter [Sphingomonas sp.]
MSLRGKKPAILAILCIAYFLSYMDRMVMATAIPGIAADFGLTPVAMGGVLSAFFLGYAAMQIPGGMLADRFGPRVTIFGAILWWSLMTLATGLAGSLAAMLVIRCLFGLGEGPFPPAASKTLSSWFDPGEVGRANGLQMAASAAGAAVAPVLVSSLTGAIGWRAVFFLLFVPGLAVALCAWLVLPAARPTTSAPARRRERLALPAPLEASLRNKNVVRCALGFLLVNMANWGLLSWLPTYLLSARHLPVSLMALFSGISALAFAAGLAGGGVICDRYFKHRLKRQIIVAVACCSLLTALAAYVSANALAVTLVTGAFFFMGVGNAAIFCVPLAVMPPSSTGTAFGVINTAGQISGVVSPLLLGAVVQNTGRFDLGLYVLVLLALIGLLPISAMKQSADDGSER